MIDIHNKIKRFGGFIMGNIKKEVEEYLYVCENSKGLSNLTIKAYRIDLKQFCGFMQNKNSLNPNLHSYKHK